MRKKFKPILFVTIFSIIALISFKTYAIDWQENYDVKLNYKIEENNGKKQVVIPVTIEDTNVKGGVLACSAEVEYDKNIFESIEIKGTEKWKDPFVTDNKLMAIKNIEYYAEKVENPFVIYLSVKDEINTSKTEVTIKNLSVGNALNSEKANKDYTIEIKLNNKDIVIWTIICVSVIAIIVVAFLVFKFIIKPKIEKKKQNEELAGLKK